MVPLYSVDFFLRILLNVKPLFHLHQPFMCFCFHNFLLLFSISFTITLQFHHSWCTNQTSSSLQSSYTSLHVLSLFCINFSSYSTGSFTNTLRRKDKLDLPSTTTGTGMWVQLNDYFFHQSNHAFVLLALVTVINSNFKMPYMILTDLLTY